MGILWGAHFFIMRMLMPVVIRDLLPPAKKIPFGTGELEIRGLRLDEVVSLLAKHKESVAPFFTGEAVEFGAMIASVPSIVAEIIALSSGTHGQEEDIMLIPAADQIDVLMAVWEISVPNVSKLAAALNRLTSDIQQGRKQQQLEQRQ